MSYNTNIPQSGQTLGNTRADINTNFSLINSTFAQDHVGPGLSGQGKHNVCHFPERASDSATAVNEIAIYCKVGTSPAESNLFFRGENSGFVYQLTKSVQAQNATFGSTTNGWTFLPGNLIMMYGSQANPGTSINTVTFPFSFPSGAAPFCLQISGQVGGANPNAISIDNGTIPTATDFRYKTSATGGSIYWMAIGR